MQTDFSHIDDVEDLTSIPAGTYLCEVAEVREGTTRDGSPRWGLRLQVAEGEFVGRTAGWDGLIWSERALPRVKGILKCFGYDVSGRLDIEPGDLLKRRIRASFYVDEYQDPVTGRRRVSLRVPFMGYEPPDPTGTPF